jgi:hypothetical protein
VAVTDEPDGEIITDSAGTQARMIAAGELRSGDVIAQGWRPFLVVDRVERAFGRVRLHFTSGHIGGWINEKEQVAVEVDEPAPAPGLAPAPEQGEPTLDQLVNFVCVSVFGTVLHGAARAAVEAILETPSVREVWLARHRALQEAASRL